jgi:hypothetical protein
VIVLVDNLYAEATDAVKWHASFSASTMELISIVGEINFEASL